jgi:hypothetical protein
VVPITTMPTVSAAIATIAVWSYIIAVAPGAMGFVVIRAAAISGPAASTAQPVGTIMSKPATAAANGQRKCRILAWSPHRGIRGGGLLRGRRERVR